MVVAEIVRGDSELALFDGSLGGAKVFLKSFPGIVGVREGLLYADIVGKDQSAR